MLLLCNSALAFAQRSVSGRVTDESGEPLVGATVQEKGTSNGTMTNADGLFSLNVAQGKTLVFSYIGYITQEIAANSTTINVTLRSDENLLDEVVVVGYGTMTRKDVTGSITTVRAEDLNVGIYTSPDQMLQGKVPGLTVVSTSDPNAATYSMTLRGASTLNSSTAPLYVVDGIPGVDLSLIAPDDIESIDVLRDASATAIYGSKAANGVIIVNTKKGKEGKANVTYSGWVSWETELGHLDMMSGDELRAYAKANGATIEDLGYNTDWAKETMRTGFAHNHNLSLSGGNATTNYMASINYIERDGIVKETGMDRVVGRAYVESTVLKNRLTFGLGVNGSISNSWGVLGLGDPKTSAYNAMYQASPLMPVKNEDGSWYRFSDPATHNPLALINEDMSKSTNK
ncbi:MAG: SusC/RagA family TonB-linked outer membrane protein, partial [Muribaculaceae bacterium]|nr:SusC/RagA family TonB-linked outer membrane protein [Muribaculaceae bacterium]